ncbi:MAG: delta 1-pyrroline-5-carboxylate synthetase [Chloroflexi bacterium]|nr:delta 1-pyrroline-5-carboxylate synthetase [Chloroflexota bacterium]
MNATVVKVGGSLTAYPEKLRTLCAKLSEASKKHRLIVVPGGGEFADVVRRLDERFFLSCVASHRMAILGMDQYGLLLSDLMPNSVTISKLKEVKYFLDLGKLPVLLPFNLMLREDPLQNSWDVTSDSIAVYLAHRLHVLKVLLITDVDGVYSNDPKKHSDAKIINNLSASELLAMNKRTSVDIALPKLLLKVRIDCFVVNGLFPERIETVLDGRDEVCTLIKGGLS